MVQDSCIQAAFLSQSLQRGRNASVHSVILRVSCLRDPFHVLQKVHCDQTLWAGIRPHAYVLVNNRAEGNAPLTVQGLVGMLRE